MSSNSERGKLIVKPNIIGNRKMRSKKNIFEQTIISFSVFFGLIILLIITAMGYWEFNFLGPEIFNINLITLSIIIILEIIFGLLIYTGGPEIHAIWEKGISSYYTTLPEKIEGRDFLLFKQISKVYKGLHGVYGKDDTEFLILVKKGEHKPYWNEHPHFTEEKYDSNFFEKLKRSIKKNAPQAEWIKINKRFEHARACSKYFKGRKL